jgi:hypothetical protein
MALGIARHVWTIGELLNAAAAVAPTAPTATAPDRRRRFYRCSPALCHAEDTRQLRFVIASSILRLHKRSLTPAAHSAPVML